MIKKIILAGGIALLPVTSFADVELTSWGTSASVITFSECPSYCTGTIYTDEVGGINQTTANLSYTNESGSTEALAEINGAGYTPVLKARSISVEGRGVNANAYGIQQYTYTGNTPTTLELDLNLHGVVIGNGRITGHVAVIKGEDIPWTGDMGTLVYELVQSEDVLAYDSVYLTEGADENATTTLSIELEAGDTFFVRADLLTRGRQGGSADAFNTFTMEFSDDSQLVAASNPEPQPEPEPELTKEVVIHYLWTAAYDDQRFNFFERFIIHSAAKMLGMSRADSNLLKNAVIEESNPL